jgi:hypothetical protein
VSKPIVASITVAVGVVLTPAARIFLTEDDGGKLSIYQAQCHTLHAVHVVEMANKGIFFKAGEAFRTEWQALEYAKKGIGVANSLHTKSLAWDKFVFVNNQVSFKPEDYKVAGEHWEALGKKYGIETAWGGRFNDAVHFSCSYKGIK